jgi:RNA polymerase sigma factor (sigma-70 family)
VVTVDSCLLSIVAHGHRATPVTVDRERRRGHLAVCAQQVHIWGDDSCAERDEFRPTPFGPNVRTRRPVARQCAFGEEETPPAPSCGRLPEDLDPARDDPGRSTTPVGEPTGPGRLSPAPDYGRSTSRPAVLERRSGMEPFEHVVARHGAVVLRVCRAVVGPDDAEDAWSETFLSALRAYPELDEEADVRAWLVTIAHRRAIDVWRARARRAVPAGALPDRRADDDDPHRWDGRLWAALRSLPDKQRTTVAYHHVAGLTYAEVAAIVGGTEAAARRAAADGIAALRRAASVDDRQGVDR